MTTSATSMAPTPGCDRSRDRPREAPPPASPVATVTSPSDIECHNASEVQNPPTTALQRLAQNLHRLARNLTRVNQNPQDQTWTNHSPLRQLETGRGATEAGERRGSREEEEEDVELLIPVSDSDSSSSVSDIRQLLVEPHPSTTIGHASRHPQGNGCRGGRDGPCEHCGMVHTAQIPDACLEATGKTESSDDELLLLC